MLSWPGKIAKEKALMVLFYIFKWEFVQVPGNSCNLFSHKICCATKLELKLFYEIEK